MHLPLLQAPVGTTLPGEVGPHSIAAVRVLRISLTDRCNLRCVYCMPAEGMRWLPQAQLLSVTEIVEVVRAAAEIHGITRIKLTGGEPTVRPDLPQIIEAIARINAVREISLTTNGVLLKRQAGDLKQAGLDRITISLDSLKPERFSRITRNGNLTAVLRGLAHVIATGFAHTKINCVVMRYVNDDEAPEFARMTLNLPVTVRFIEYMPLGDAAIMHTWENAGNTRPGTGEACATHDRGEAVLVPEREVRARVEAALGKLLPVPRVSESGVGPAEVYRLAEGNPRGRIGFVSAMSEPFCSSCNRLRLKATGRLRACLFEQGEVDLMPLLRGDLPRKQLRLAAAMTRCVQFKPEVHGEAGSQPMSRIGG